MPGLPALDPALALSEAYTSGCAQLTARGHSGDERRMGLFGKLFDNLGALRKPANDQAVLVYFDYGRPDLSDLFALEDRLLDAIADAHAGELDGNEVAADRSDATVFMYGPDADALFEAVQPVLLATDFTRNARVVIRYGPPQDGVRQREIHLG
jgi:hypothetical protein